MSKLMDWIKAGSLVTGSVVAATKALLEYNAYKREQAANEHTRALQQRAWEKVISGELASARVGDMTIRAARPPKPAAKPAVTAAADAADAAPMDAPTASPDAPTASPDAPPSADASPPPEGAGA